MALPFLDPDEEPFHLRQAISQGWKFLRGLLNGEENTYGAAGIDPSWLGGGAAPGVWTDFDPSFDSTGGGFSLGASAVIDGEYVQFGTIVVFVFSAQASGTGIAAGTGNVTFTVPVNFANTASTKPRGICYLFDNSNTANNKVGIPAPNTSSRAFIRIQGSGAATGTDPWVGGIASGDFIMGLLVYEGALS